MANWLCTSAHGLFTPFALFPFVLSAQAVPITTVIPAPSFSTEIAWTDVDGDGHRDALAILPDGTARLVMSEADGMLVDRTELVAPFLPERVVDANWGDYDVDGRPDLLVVSGKGKLRLARNAESRFEDATPLAFEMLPARPLAAEWHDHDRDGLPDVVLHTTSATMLLLNMGAGYFQLLTFADGSCSGAPPRDVATGPETSNGLASPDPDGPQASPGDGSAITQSGIWSSARSGSAMPAPSLLCARSVEDTASGGCLQASSQPEMGKLYPLGPDFFVSPGGTLEIGSTLISPDNSCGAGRILLLDGLGTTGVDIQGRKCTGAGGLLVLRSSAQSRVVLDADVNGKGRVTTGDLVITGGADLVEGFDTGSVELEPGTVAVIDPERPGSLRASDEAYDARVAGVVSGAGGVDHGLRMGQEGAASGDTLVALTGRVYVKCTTENGSIRAGDLLATSATVGHAMKATDRDRSFGAIIGKALSSLHEGTGLVLVLVGLQ